MTSFEQLQIHAERIRASGALGRSELMLRLFNYFVDCARTQRVPKEIEVGLDVFGKKADFDVGQDAVVRVYIHKLRRKLDDYYAGPGKDDESRWIIPKGEYRFVFQDHAESPLQAEEPEPDDPVLNSEAEVELESLVASAAARSNARRWVPWLMATVAALLITNLATLVLRPTVQRDSADLQAVRSNPIWAKLLDDSLPIYIVVGDYYIFGELSDDGSRLRRLVRDFDINSPNELEQHLKNSPDLADRYMDLSLQYLPTSTAFALRNLMPILEPNNKGARQVQVILASDLTPTMTRSAHIIYVGLVSGMGILRQIVFDGSRFAIGDSFDELIDLQTGKHYVSQASAAFEDSRAMYMDYGYFSARTTKDGNELVILAGTRDVALLHVAESVTQSVSLASLDKQADVQQGFEGFEALYSVKALERSSLGGRLLLTHQFAARQLGAAASSSVAK
ncbi:MAG: hypothetical protein AB7F79_10315 [Steroidobacteraceae bacterium]